MNYGPIGAAPIGALWQNTAPSTGFYESVSDAVVLDDAVSCVRVMNLSITENMGLDDSVTQLLVGLNTVAQQIDLLDIIESQLTAFNAYADAIELGELAAVVDFSASSSRLPVPVLSRAMRVPPDAYQSQAVPLPSTETMRVAAERRTMRVKKDE